MQESRFLPLNAQRMPPSSYRPSPPSARAPQPEPDRSQVEGYEPPPREETLRSRPEPPGPERQAPEMAAKKKRVRSPESIARQKATLAAKKTARGTKQKRAPRASAEQREIAVARVQALVKAGEQRKIAVRRVAKELGYKGGAVAKWLVEAGDRSRAPRSDRVVEARPVTAAGTAAVASLAQMDLFAEQLVKAVADITRAIVREEIRRMLA